MVQGKNSTKVNRLWQPLYFSVSARACHCGNPALQSDMAPRKTKKGPISFYKTTGLTRRSISKAIPVLEIATDTVTNITNISSLATKIRQKFWFSHHNGDYISLCSWSIQLFCHTLCPSRQSYWKIFASKTFNIRKEVNPSFCSVVLIISHRKTSKFEITL